MKKNIENLLFDLLENSHIKLIKFQSVDEAYLQIDSPTDPIRAQIFQAVDAPDKVKVSIILRKKSGTTDNEIIIVPSKSIENFLSFAHYKMERQDDKAQQIISEHGQAKFNELRDDVLNILAEKTSKNFTLIEDYRLDGQGNVLFTIEDKKNGINSIITIKEKQDFNNILPIKIHLQTVISSGSGLKSAGMDFFVEANDLEKYSLLPQIKPTIKTEEQFLDDLINANNTDPYLIQSKVLQHFNLSVSLPEKENNQKSPKI
jgi:hypothetical protein